MQPITNELFLIDNPEEDKKLLEFLRQHSDEAEVKPIMLQTVFQRRTVIRRLNGEGIDGFDKIPPIMPRLFDMMGMVKFYEIVP